MFKNLFSLTLALSFFAPATHANNGAIAEGQTGGANTQTTNVNVAPTTSGGNKYDSARTEEGASSGGAGANAMIGAGLMAAGGVCMAATCSTGCSPGCFVLLAMGGMAAMQSAMTGGDAGKSGGIADMAYSCPTCDTNLDIPEFYKTGDGDPSIFSLDPNKKVPFGPYGTIGEIQQSLIKSGKILDEQGIKLNADGSATLADGTVISAEQMQAAAGGEGLRLEDAQKVKDLMAQAKKLGEEAEAYSVASMDIGGEGGGGGGSSFKPYESSFDMSKYLNGMNKKRKPATVVGKTKRINGEPIGVAGDDIFKMIHRRYQAKSRTKTFIDNLPGAVSPRKPAARRQ